jgi:acetylornithine/succinyldiaminopimelate/putrescine aminotransferase/predicted amino acid dehydrogenase/acyl-coenzyme A synthetase/AMP-(fatty) acid ligase
MKTSFDVIVENPILINGKQAKTIAQILFEPVDEREENSNIILSHIENDYIEISLFSLRLIVRNLIRSFQEKEIRRGQTVILLTFNGCNEMFTALFFLALASAGCRVFMPMYSEKIEFSEWIDLTGSVHIILPEGEVMSLDGHNKEKSDIAEIKNTASLKGLKIWDNLADFGLMELIRQSDGRIIRTGHDNFRNHSTAEPDDEVLIVTTSGTSGRSRLVVYTHKAYYFNCLSWKQAGFYKPELLGGTGFTPLFTHTMGVRAFINALWTGAPVCLIITEWFFEKPELVRYFLLKMKPSHITGGPAVYNTFFELFRIYPELKSGLKPYFKTLVSSGASYNPVTAKEVSDATGLSLHNAFGTTETQQVLSTLLSQISVFQHGLVPLGKPLPGVSVGLIKSETGTNHYRMFLKSVFSHKQCIDKDEITGRDFYDSGDIVILDDNKDLFYYGRASQDYFKDNFGVKIPVNTLRNYYNELLCSILHAEFYPILNFPGISSLLFISDSNLPEGAVTDNRVLKKYAGIIEGINNRLINTIEAFEFQHRHICRIAVLNQSPPLTRKGSISVKEINFTWHSLIERLTDTRMEASGIEITEKLYHLTDRFTRYVSPMIGSMMSALKINLSFHRSLKDSLFTYMHGVETEILDLVGGYGTNLTGHYHPVICKALTEFIASGKPAICNQASIQQTTGLLAEKLNLLINPATGRSFNVMFANSGTEAVEIALHHAFFEWKKRLEKLRDQQIQLYACDKTLDVRGIWADNMQIINGAVIRVIGLVQAFHGHSTGARSIQGNEKKSNFFQQLSHIEPLFIDDRDLKWHEKLDDYYRESVVIIRKIISEKGYVECVPYKVSTIIAALAEPVIGEGGVRVVNREFLHHLATQEFPLISDEIQCGLGRSGKIPECESAQYLLFGKALGGGIEKISAVMIDSSHYSSDFGENYVSTFGNGELAAHVAIMTLKVIEDENVTLLCTNAGNYIHDRLAVICKQFSSVILDIKGKGLMQAIYFNPECSHNSIFLRILFQTEKAGYLFAAWFLNCHHIRILPTLSASNVLRIEPSAYISESETDRFCNALTELCEIIRDNRIYDLFSFLMDDDPFVEKPDKSSLLNHYNSHPDSPDEGSAKVAFIAHFAFPLRELRMLEPDFEKASDTGLRIFFKKIQILLGLKPVQMIATHLFNRKVHFSFYVIPIDSAELEFLHKSGKRQYVVSKIQEAVDLASANGAKIISLGGYTSILSNNGLSLAEPAGSRIITGNTLTAASGLMHLGNVIRQRPEFNKPNTIAVIGSTGNIGRIITEMLYEQDEICSDLILVSRSKKREFEFMKNLSDRKNKNVGVRSTNNLLDIKEADVVVICTNTNDPVIYPHHISHDKPVIISDLSVPSAVSEEVKCLSNVTVLPFVSYVSLSEDRDVVISSYSPPGTLFCCAAEAVLLALEPCNEQLKGRITPEAVKTITRLAARHGFFNSVETMKSYKTTYF